MELETYYRRRFPIDLQQAIQLHSHKFGEDQYFSSHDFSRSFQERALTTVDAKYRPIFLCLCALGILMDEAIFTHFPDSYTDFRYITVFPKVEYGITGTHVNPWSLLEGKRIEDGLFENCAAVFLQDMRSLFSKTLFSPVTWQDVENALSTDQDVARGRYGGLLLRVLKNDLKAIERPVRPPRKEDFLHILSEEEAEECLRELSHDDAPTKGIPVRKRPGAGL